MHTDERGRLLPDEQQDFTLLDVVGRQDKVYLTFERKYDTCDEHDYLLDVSERFHAFLWILKIK